MTRSRALRESLGKLETAHYIKHLSLVSTLLMLFVWWEERMIVGWFNMWKKKKTARTLVCVVCAGDYWESQYFKGSIANMKALLSPLTTFQLTEDLSLQISSSPVHIFQLSLVLMAHAEDIGPDSAMYWLCGLSQNCSLLWNTGSTFVNWKIRTRDF